EIRVLLSWEKNIDGMVFAMIVEYRNKLVAACLLFALIPFFIVPASAESTPSPVSTSFRQRSTWDASGPYVDRAIFEVITGLDVQVAALIAGDIDHLADNIEASYIDELSVNPNIEVTQTERLGFGFMAINCLRYPYSIPAFRRALAFAMDKHAAANAMWGDLGYAIDTPIPASCGVWHNDHITPDFRGADVEAARVELAKAGFVDRDGDGFVEAPNGESFTFRPMVSIEAPQWEQAINASLVYWEQAGLRVVPLRVAFCTLLDIVYTVPRNYDAACYAYGLSPNPLMLRNFITAEVANPEGNMLNWGNRTYDDWIEVMMTASDYTEVVEAAHNAQQVFVENAPMIVMYSNWEVNAHRTDCFEGWVEIPGWGTAAMNRWTPRKVKLKEGQPYRDTVTGCGGTYRTTISSAMDSQNPLTSTSVYSGFPLSQVYSSLTGLNDDQHLATKNNGGLAYDWVVESHPYGLKYTFTLFDNASWHDLGGAAGGKVTADDVEFSYNYILDHNIPTYSRRIPYLNSCRAIDDQHVEIITNGESYWAFDFVRGWVILPEHIWSGIVTPVTFTNPRPVGCGPFTWYRRREGVYVELHYWECYHKGIPGHYSPYCCCCGEPMPLYPVIGVSVIIGTLILSGIYLSSGRRNAGQTERAPTGMEKRLRSSTVTMRDVYCTTCGTRVSDSDRFCAVCGHQIRE
ncbi:MAG: ABC transporter substrate-binding protein, partial [Promethearchaeota archaeon]